MPVLYKNGDILLMSGDSAQYAECVVTEGEKILHVGDLSQASPHLLARPDLTEVDLAGQCLMPGFIDPHIHPSMAGLILSMDWITAFDWSLPDRSLTGVRTPGQYREKLEALVKTKTVEDGMIITWGYHHYYHGSLTKQDLDLICPDKPLIVWHRSFHELYMNTVAMTQAEYEDEEALRNHHQVDWEKGHFFEGGMENLMTKSTLFLTILDRLEAGYKSAVAAIHAGGITTIADLEFPMLNEDVDFEFASRVLKSPEAEFYTYCVPSSRIYGAMKGSHKEAIKEIRRKAESFSDSKVIMFRDHVKVFADGAFFSQLMQMKEGYTDGHSGEWFTSPEDMEKTMAVYWAEGFQIHIHTNGDLAMEVVLDIVERLSTSQPRPDHRTTIEHAGIFNSEQAERLRVSGCLVSAQPYYHYTLADKYREVGLGPDRASTMCPLALLERRGVRLALHSDFTMAPANPLLLAWCAVNRLTVEDEEGPSRTPELCISPYTAIRGITASAAEVLGIQHKVGSIEVGKEANLVILDRNPLKVEPREIRNVKVMKRIFQGVACKH